MVKQFEIVIEVDEKTGGENVKVAGLVANLKKLGGVKVVDIEDITPGDE